MGGAAGGMILGGRFANTKTDAHVMEVFTLAGSMTCFPIWVNLKWGTTNEKSRTWNALPFPL